MGKCPWPPELCSLVLTKDAAGARRRCAAPGPRRYATGAGVVRARRVRYAGVITPSSDTHCVQRVRTALGCFALSAKRSPPPGPRYRFQSRSSSRRKRLRTVRAEHAVSDSFDSANTRFYRIILQKKKRIISVCKVHYCTTVFEIECEIKRKRFRAQ